MAASWEREEERPEERGFKGLNPFKFALLGGLAGGGHGCLG